MIKKTVEFRNKQRPLKIRSAWKAAEADYERHLESGDNPEERRIMYARKRTKKI